MLKIVFSTDGGDHILSMTGFLEYWSRRRAILAIFFLTVKGYCYCWWILFPTLNSMMRHFISHWTPVSHIATCWGERGKKSLSFLQCKNFQLKKGRRKPTLCWFCHQDLRFILWLVYFFVYFWFRYWRKHTDNKKPLWKGECKNGSFLFNRPVPSLSHEHALFWLWWEDNVVAPKSLLGGAQKHRRAWARFLPIFLVVLYFNWSGNKTELDFQILG